MEKIETAILTALLCIPLTAWITAAFVRRNPKLTERPFRPIYTKRESVLDQRDLKDYKELEPHLERAGVRLLPNMGLQQIATLKKELLQSESSIQAYSDLDGRTVQFLLVETPKLVPLAVLHIGGDGSPPQYPHEWLAASVTFCSELFESIKIPEIVVLDKDMADPARVVARILEITQSGKAGVVKL